MPKSVTGIFSGERSDEWATPQDVFDEWNDKFHFDLDACATLLNTKCTKFYSLESLKTGLGSDWHKDSKTAVWCNPPYSNCSDWLAKAYEESQLGATVVCLVNAATETAWFQQYLIPLLDPNNPGELHFRKGRISFVHPERGIGKAPCKGSVFAVFRPCGKAILNIDIDEHLREFRHGIGAQIRERLDSTYNRTRPGVATVAKMKEDLDTLLKLVAHG